MCTEAIALDQDLNRISAVISLLFKVGIKQNYFCQKVPPCYIFCICNAIPRKLVHVGVKAGLTAQIATILIGPWSFILVQFQLAVLGS